MTPCSAGVRNSAWPITDTYIFVVLINEGWRHVNVDIELFLWVSPLTSLFLDTQESLGRGQPGVGPSEMSTWRCASHCLGPHPASSFDSELRVSSHGGSLRVEVLPLAPTLGWNMIWILFLTSPLSGPELGPARGRAGGSCALGHLAANWEEGKRKSGSWWGSRKMYSLKLQEWRSFSSCSILQNIFSLGDLFSWRKDMAFGFIFEQFRKILSVKGMIESEKFSSAVGLRVLYYWEH